MAKPDGQQVLKTFSQMVNDRLMLEVYWKDAFDYSYPVRGQAFGNLSGSKSPSNDSEDEAVEDF